MPRLVNRAPKVLVSLRLSEEGVEWADHMAAEMSASRMDVLRAAFRVAVRHADAVRDELSTASLCGKNCVCFSVPGWPRTEPDGVVLHLSLGQIGR